MTRPAVTLPSIERLFPPVWLWLLPVMALGVLGLSWVSPLPLWRLNNAAILWVALWGVHAALLTGSKASPFECARFQGLLLRLGPVAYALPFALWAAMAQLSSYYNIEVNGADFSIFDWMLFSTRTGRFGFSPIYELNHFGVHSTFHLLLLVPLHGVFESSLLLSVTTVMLFLAGAWMLYRLAAHLQLPMPLRLLALASYFANPWSSRMLNGGYMPEFGFAFGYLWFLHSVFSVRRWSMVAAVVFLFATKEDTPFYLACAAVAFAWARQPGFTWRTWAALFAACVTWFLVYNRLLQPLLLGQTGLTQPAYLGYWSQHGRTLGEIVWSIASHPWRLIADIAKSNALNFLWPCLFLPLFDRRTALPIAFGVCFLGSANYQAMNRYWTYYPLPMLAFCLVGMLLFAARQRGDSLRDGLLAGVALMLFAVVGGTTAMTAPFGTERHEALARLGEHLMATRRDVRIQTILFPHMGYSERFLPLLDLSQCRKTDVLAVVDLQQRTYPIPLEDWGEWLQRQESRNRVEYFPKAQAAVIDCLEVE